MLNEIEILREIARRCLAGQPLETDQSVWLGSSLDKFLSHGCRTIEEALGLHAPKGGVPWWLEEAIRQRDEALRCLALDVEDNVSMSARAKEIRTLSLRYAASAWRFDRKRDAMPNGYRRTEREHLWRAFKSGATMPIGECQLRNILAGASS